MIRVNNIELHRLYAITGGLAVLAGGSLSAGFAKQPSTLPIWTSAYLVLVVGVAQIFLAVAVMQLLGRQSQSIIYWIYGLFNTGSLLTIMSTILKYSGYSQHLAVTMIGAGLIIAAMVVLGWKLHNAKASLFKTATYGLVGLLMISSLLGLVLATLD